MSILAANLRHFYQRRWLWLWYVVIGGFGILTLAIPFREESIDKGSFVLWLIVSIIAGCITAGLVQDILGKPLVFCLPGHQKAVKKVHLAAALGVNLPPAFIFCCHDGLYLWEMILTIISAFSAGMICYGICVVIIMGLRFGARLVALIGLAPLIAIWQGYHVKLERFLIERPFYVIGAAVVFWVFLYFWLDLRRYGRNLCSRIYLGLFDATNYKKQQQYHRQKWAVETVKGRKTFLAEPNEYIYNMMLSCKPLSRDRYFWGAIYEGWSPYISTRHLGFWLLFGLFIVVLGYFTELYYLFLYIIPLVGIMQIKLPVHTDFLLPASRSDRFFGTVLFSILTSFSIILLLLSASLLIDGLASFAPVLVFGESSYSLHPFEIYYICIPLIMIPIIFIFQLLFRRDKAIATIGLLIVIIVLSNLTKFIAEGGVRLVIEMVTGLWVVYLGVLGYHCYRRCLVGP